MCPIPLRPIAPVQLFCVIACCGLLTSLTHAEAQSKKKKPRQSKPTAVLSERFEDGSTKEIPDFQKHVIPLLGKLGCNGRSCHGSFQGRGGFQLSLFGYDFAADHAAMMDESSGRIVLEDADESLVLAKPLDGDLHEGGQRFKRGSWEHNVLKNWITAGATNNSPRPHTLKKLVVSPAEIQFENKESQVDLRAYAHWNDGSVEDVSVLCRFSSNDDAIAAITDSGQVTSTGPGDTHIVVSYDNAVVPVPVIRPYSNHIVLNPKNFAHPIDRLVSEKLNKLGIEPSNLCTDSEYIRRVSLDITGILPSSDSVSRFLSDTDPSKRERFAEQLLQSSSYAAWWATRFSDWTGNSDEQLNNALPFRNVATRLWYEWLRARLEKNVPYDDIVEGIVTAQSRNPDESYLDYCRNMTEACQPGNESQFAERKGMPLFWARRNFQSPEDRAIGFSYTFLGVRIECAQCHKHPFDQWSKDDFEQFAKLFSPIRTNQNLVASDARKERDQLVSELTGDKKVRGADLRRILYAAAKDGKTVPFGELMVNVRDLTDREKRARALAKKQGKTVKAPPIPTGRILGKPELISLNKDPRVLLMKWLREPSNPYFAKAIVNRVWSNYFGIGLVDPTDDMNLANPASNGPLLDHLANSFVENNYDLKWLHWSIVTSDTYQRSATPNVSNSLDQTNFARHIPRRLPAEVIYDAVVLATGSDQRADALRNNVSEMAIADGKPKRRNQQDFALEVFGQSLRETNCDCDRSDSPSLLQSIYLRNDVEMHQRLTDSRGWVSQVCKELQIPSPRVIGTPQVAANKQRAESIRKLILKQVVRYKQASEAQQRKFRPQLERELKRASERLATLGFQTPNLDQLLKEKNPWPTATTAIPESRKAMKYDDLVNEAYLRTLSRFPDPEEAKISMDYIAESENPGDGVASLLWALVNTKEFIISH